MADEAFALSPIAARPVQPNEADYEAIREAFMETSRGRWFLGEYAKRNRNADTAMVLDAVARIENALAAQRQEPPADDGLAEALAAIRSAVEAGAQAASAALATLQLEENLAPIHKGTRIIKEISWRWREIGADGRICDLIDAQVAAIEASCARIAEADASAALSAAFDLIRHKLDVLNEDDAPPAAAAATCAGEMVAPAATPVPEQAVAARPNVEPAAAAAPTEIAFAEPEIPTETADPERAIGASDVAPTEAAAADAAPTEPSTEAADAHDEAVLEMVAIEMAAPDPVGDFLAENTTEQATVPAAVAPVATAEPAMAVISDQPPEPALEMAPAAPEPQIVPAAAPPMAAQPSLGSTILANGILERPKASSDPLAPIRRMTQAEKIAIFS